MKDEKILQDELMSDEELDKVAGGGDTPEEIVELLKKSGDVFKDTGKNIEEMMKLLTGDKTSTN